MSKGMVVLERALNFRSLGGYASKFGGNTRDGRLFRADSLENLTDADVRTVRALGVRASIDLRSSYEIDRAASKLADTEGLAYYNVPLLDDVHSRPQDGMAFPSSMGEMYIHLLDGAQGSILKVFDILDQYSDAGVVFHCTAGKDRTGIIAALLLDLLGVDRVEIVRDYTLTQILMQPIFAAMAAGFEKNTGIPMPAHVLESKEESIVTFLDHLYGKYGGARAYLIAIGFGEDRTDRFVDAHLERASQ